MAVQVTLRCMVWSQDGLCEEAEVITNGKRVLPATRLQALTARIAYTLPAYHSFMHAMAIKLG